MTKIKECGWPLAEDGHCGEPATMLYLIYAAEVPLITADDETHPVVLGLCAVHDPNHVDAQRPVRRPRG